MGCFANWVNAFFSIFDGAMARRKARLEANEKRLQELMTSARKVTDDAKRAGERADKITEDLKASEQRVKDLREGL